MEKIKIIKTGINGEGIGYLNKIPVFIDGVFVGETAIVEKLDKFNRYYKAKASQIINPSRNRIISKCKVTSECGGCTLINLKYGEQLRIKQDILSETLIKYAHIKPSIVSKIIPSDDIYGYRNQIKLPIKKLNGKLVCGMYAKESNRLIEMNKCLIHSKGLDTVKNEVLEVLNKYHLEEYSQRKRMGLRYLVIRGFDNKYQVTIVTGKDKFAKEIIDDLSKIDNICSLYQNVNLNRKNNVIFSTDFKHLAKDRTINVKLDNISIDLSPDSFFQLNYNQAQNIYREVANNLVNTNVLVEAYCGVGAISLYCKNKAKKIIGIEIVRNAINNAKNNAKNNNAKNVEFVKGDAFEELAKISKKEKIDSLIVDPPRSGLDDDILNTICIIKPKQIIYVSCNPATLAKNLDILKDYYNIDKIVPYDMFPNTALVECVCTLSLKK